MAASSIPNLAPVDLAALLVDLFAPLGIPMSASKFIDTYHALDGFDEAIVTKPGLVISEPSDPPLYEQGSPAYGVQTLALKFFGAFGGREQNVRAVRRLTVERAGV